MVDVVVHPQFVIRQRSFVAPAVRQHPVALVGQALVPQLFEGPNHRLHVSQIERLVIVVEVDPASLPSYIRLPLVGVAQHGCAAGIVEGGDTHGLDLGFVSDAKLALDFEFGGQPVSVPAEATLHLVTAHSAISRHDVFDVAGEQVPIMRQTVGKRRPVIEHILGGAIAASNAGPEGVVTGPVVEDLEFECREVGCPAGQLWICVIGHFARRLPRPQHRSALRACNPGSGTTPRRCANAAVPPRLPRRCAAARLEAVTGQPVRFYWA